VIDYTVDHWGKVGKAHREFFGEIRSATSLVRVRRLIAPGILVEIKTDPIVLGKEVQT
jgi:hypothetical protein